MPPKLRTAVILAAGMGRRLTPYTDDMPKCLVPIGQRPLLAHQLDAFRRGGLSDFAVVRGYKGDVLQQRAGELGAGVRFVDNPSFRTTKMLASLFCAAPSLEGAYLVSYGHVVYRPEVVQAVLDAEGEVVVATDRDFRTTLAARDCAPEDAELVRLDDTGRVTAIGRGVIDADEAAGAFIGLARFSAEAAARMNEAWDVLLDEYEGRETDPFQRSPQFRAAHLTDMLQYLIDGGERVSPVFVRDGWCEIQSTADLERAAALLRSDEEKLA